MARSLNLIFPFFANPLNLEKITPPFLNFKILTPEPIEMKKGLLIDYKIKLYGISLRWQSEITAWDPPYRFIDEQRKGPYRLWIHEHIFEEKDRTVIIHDQVQYAVWGGNLINKFFVQKDLKKIFDYRQNVIKKVFSRKVL